jgi:hypothetical protein
MSFGDEPLVGSGALQFQLNVMMRPMRRLYVLGLFPLNIDPAEHKPAYQR